MIVNLTEHAINVCDDNGTLAEVYQPSGLVARVEVKTIPAGKFDGIPVTFQVPGDVTGLPSPVPGTLYLVSAMVRMAVLHRDDVASPGVPVRAIGGQIIGCKGFIVNP